MREVCGEYFVFQQGNVPAHRARETINLLRRETPKPFTPKSIDMNLFDHKQKREREMQQRVYRVQY